MAAVLQPTISNPFNTTPGPPSCRLDGPFSFPEQPRELDAISLNTIIHERSRQPSPASTFSVASAPLQGNDENASPLARFKKGNIQLRSTSAQATKVVETEFEKRLQRHRNFTFQPLVAGLTCSEITKQSQASENEATVPGQRANSSSRTAEASEDIEKIKIWQGPRPSTPLASIKSVHEHLKETSIAKVRPLNHSHNAMRTPETSMLSRIRELRSESTSRDHDAPNSSPTPSQGLIHQQHISDSSSGFVRSMKTASMTNASFSIYPRSSRVGRSTDSYLLQGSQARHSIDSDRPMSCCSFDELPQKRAFRRQQIIDELISTEEAYVADLKALVYLYSTLLASTSSIPNRLRTAVEQNVAGILHSHERILERLRAARLHAAARRWADTALPTKLGQYRRYHLRQSEVLKHTNPVTGHRRTKSDESFEPGGYVPQLATAAEPIDVYDMTVIFREAVKDFAAYEEYCANFETIGTELQRHSPQLWPTYESGIESLARAVMTIDQQQANNRKGLTVGDLLIKPIQRLMRYPLLLEQLLHSTPVADAPDTHAELDTVLTCIRDTIQMVNLARDSQHTRLQIQRRWLLQDRLDLTRLNISVDEFRGLGQIELCGVLHVAYQTNTAINGAYALCVLFDEHFLVAFPTSSLAKFEAIALVQLSDIKVETSTDGKGLQCASSFFTWKISFACTGYYHELLLSGCSKVEEDHWTAGLRGDFCQPANPSFNPSAALTTAIAMDLKSSGVVFSSQKSLSRESSVQRAATVGGRPSISQVIVRNTYNAQDLNEYRDSTSSINSINRSQSHMHTKRVPVLEPKRSERTRLESSISDIWTKERLPFPGMVGSRGGQIIRASAGTLARKLSLASIHTPFSKGRTSSLSMASRRSYDLFNDAKSTFEIRRREPPEPRPVRMKPKDIPEVDDMRSVVGRMMSGGAPVRTAKINPDIHVHRKRSKRVRKHSLPEVGPDDSAAVFYETSLADSTGRSTSLPDGEAGDNLPSVVASGPRRRKRGWSRPMSKFRELKSEARGMLYSSSAGA